MVFKKVFVLLLTVLIGVSCATYNPQFKENWENPVFPSEKEIEKTFYLIGDGGLSPMGELNPALTALQNYLKSEKVSGNYTLFLGDNIYPSGMDPEGHPRRKESEHMIDAQYEAVKDYDGPTVFIPGNHEWYNGGPLGVARQERYVESLFGNQDVFKPSDGCALESVSISPEIEMIIIDTQWMLENWNKSSTINARCDIKTRSGFLLKLERELEKNRHKTIVLAMHHPMFSNGNHGGYFALDKHLYPLQKKIPMPLLASLVVQVRSQGGVSVQDRYNELYNNFMIRLQEMARDIPRLVMVSGHDHTLQYIERDGFRQIVSGAGAKESYAATGDDGYFSTGALGFAVLDVFKDGSSWVRTFVAGDDRQPKLLFQKEIIPAPEKVDVSVFPHVHPQHYTLPIYRQDSIREALFFQTVWGAKYKDAYSQPVTAPVADLDTLFGGLTVVREQHGKDYKALLLTDQNGNQYRMRPMAKNALNVQRKIAVEEGGNPSDNENQVNPSLKGRDLEFYTATHPYVEMAIPEMAKAVGIFHTTPKLFYVPKQKNLEDYNTDFGDALYMISVEPTETSEGDALFEYPDDVETTEDLLIKIRKTGTVFIDEERYIKSRLFDMLIGDWDRDPDQWRWAKYSQKSRNEAFVPIPTSRDHAFSSFEGNFLDLTRSLFSGTKQAHIYGEDLTDLQWFNQEGIILDRVLIRNSGRAQWKFLAEMIRENLSDEMIDKAFEDVPVEVRDEALEEIKQKLKARRENLVDIADRYYTHLAVQQTIVGTDHDDIFEITRLTNGETNVRSFRSQHGQKSDTLVNRTFSASDTKELWVYGLGGSDHFTVHGSGKDMIFLRLIGGLGKDVYELKEGKRVKVYDYERKEDSIAERRGGNFRFTNVYNLNNYDPRKQMERSHNLISAIGYNPDDGFRAALQYEYRIDNFQRNPFSRKHTLNAAYFTDINSFDISYEGEIANIMNDLNLSFGGRFTSPNYTMNYFGIGNETQNPQDTHGFGFNRVEVQQISADVGLLRNSNFGSFFKLQAGFDAFEVAGSPTGFIESTKAVETDKRNYFGTIEGIYSYRSHDDPRNPTIGMLFDLNVGITDDLDDTEKVFGFIKSRVGFYNSLVKSRKLVLKTNVRHQINLGPHYQFYQAATLGGDNGLRGFREQRFSGKSFLVGNADLRYSFPTFKIGLYPLQIGVFGGADLGRVWLKDDRSDRWHNSYGGGLWFHGTGGLNANFNMFHSKEGSRITFGLGFDF